MMNIPIDNDDTLSFAPKFRCGNGNVVHQTEPHRSIGQRVMPRRANEGECSLRSTRVNLINSRKHCAGGTPRRVE